MIRNGLRWQDAPAEYGPHKTIYNQFVRCSRLGVFDRIFAALAGKAGRPDTLMINATHLKAHRPRRVCSKKSSFPMSRMQGLLADLSEISDLPSTGDYRCKA